MRFVWSSGFDEGEVSNAHRPLIDYLPRARELPIEVCLGHFGVVFVTVGGDVRQGGFSVTCRSILLWPRVERIRELAGWKIVPVAGLSADYLMWAEHG